MLYRVEVAANSDKLDPTGAGTAADIGDLGIKGAGKVRTVVVYVLETDAGRQAVERFAEHVLADPVADFFSVDGAALDESADGLNVVEVARRAGVMDPVAASVIKSAADIGIEITYAATSRKFLIYGDLTDAELELVCQKVLANPTVEEYFLGGRAEAHKPETPEYHFELVTVRLLGADDAELERISRDGQLFLNVTEMREIQKHFDKLGRDPTDIELETLAQTWSEHCVHKTFRGKVKIDGRTIDNLLKTTIARVTRELDKPWCVSVFEDNAGVIRFDAKNNVCFKVETHNHPSAIEPYGGAGTGIGGVIRDPLGTGMGAKPILNTDIFCFGPPDYPHEKVPRGCLHPKRIMKGVVAGVRDYGNRMGIPTSNGSVFFDERYIGNPLVYCGNIGLMPKEMSFKHPHSGDVVVVIGGRTGRDGIHGATFSSGELSEDSEMVSAGAVQIGNPIEEKKMVDVLLVARDRGLYSAITDCGAGGLSSAVGEMGEELGAEVDLEKVPLKYAGLAYWEIWVSEAQERMVLAVPPGKLDELLALAESEDVEATVIGSYTDDKVLRLRYRGRQVLELDMGFLHHGVPQIERTATWTPPQHPEPELAPKKDYGPDLLGILAAPNVASKEWIVRQYDHEVHGTSVLKPLVGAENDGPGDAAVIAPVLGSKRGIAVSNGINPKYGAIDTYHMAASAIDEAVRQIVAVGGSVSKTAILDNFSWGNTDKPDRLGALVRACEACYEVGVAYGTPFISGKDSLNNEYQVAGETIVIPHTLLISAMSVMADVTKAVSMDAKEAGDLLYIVGLTKRELGASHYWESCGYIGQCVPTVDTKLGKRVFAAVEKATKSRLARACHDLSEGGLAVAAAEMAFAGMIGMDIDLRELPVAEDVTRDDEALFSESNSRLLVEVGPSKRRAFEKACGKAPHACIGKLVKSPRLKIKGLDGKVVVNENISDLKSAWKGTLDW